MVTKSKYGPAVMSACEVLVDSKLIRNPAAYGSTNQAIPTPSAKKNKRDRDPRPRGSSFAGRQPGRDERPELVEQDRHGQDDPDHDRDLDLDDEGVAEPGEEQRRVASGSADRGS